jgi:H+/Cl- antiporter ClcA
MGKTTPAPWYRTIRTWLDGHRDLSEIIRFLAVFIKWLALGTLIGLIVGFVGCCFAHVLSYVNTLRGNYPWLVLGLPFGGLLIVLLYRACRNTSDKGTNTIVASIQSSTEIPFKMAPLIFLSTTVTHLFGGSAGREGAALQLGGSIGKRLGRLLKLNENSQRTMIMCGMSAGFSALFGTPMAAAVFSMEVVSVGVMHYSAFVPCVVASMTAHFLAQWFHVPPEVFPVTDIPGITPASFGSIIVFAAVIAFTSILFCVLLHKTEYLYEKYIKNQYLRIFIAGLLVVGLAAALGTGDYLGSGMGIIEHIFHHGQATPWYGFLLKMLFTALTLGAGFKGGEIVPSFTIGAALGSVCSAILGLPMELVAACGMVGLFCGVTNSPITSLLIAFELFGLEGMPYYLTTVAVSFMLSGYHSLYHKQRISYSKTETHYWLGDKPLGG